MFKRKTVINALFLLAVVLCIQSSSGINTGMIQFVEPKSEQFNVDFTDLQTFKSNDVVTGNVSIDSADLYFTGVSIISPYGIRKTTLDEFYKKYINGKTLTADKESHLYLDSSAKKIKLSMGLFTTTDSVKNKMSLRDSVLIVNTREGGVAVLLQTYVYIGGYDRYYYYWIYQSSSDTILYKNNLISTFDSLTIIPNIFSGRPDPVFTIKDKSFTNELVTQLYASVNKYLSQYEIKQEWVKEPLFGGLRSLWVQKYASTNDYPCFQLVKNEIYYHQMSEIIASFVPTVAKDTNYQVLRYIIKYAILNNVQTQDMYGVINFKDLMPENLINEIDTCSAERFWNLISGQVTDIHKGTGRIPTQKHCRVSFQESELVIESQSGILKCTVVRLDGSVVKTINVRTAGTYKLFFDNVSRGVLYVKGTVIHENGVESVISLRVIH